MALVTTTTSAAVAAGDNSVNLTSVSGLTVGMLIKIDQEFMAVAYTSATIANPVAVRRGLNGTFAAAHVSGANASYAASSDTTAWGDASATVVVAYPLAGLRRKVLSYSATGAITLPVSGEDMVAILNGTTGLTMTVAVPTKDIDGAQLWIASNGAATTTTVQFTGGLSGAGGSYDVLTINTTAPVLLGPFMAVNGLWQAAAGVAIAGTVTALTATIG